MLEQFLHEQLEIAFEWGVPKPEIPGSITQNLNPVFELRPYQEDAYASFIHYFNTDSPRTSLRKPIFTNTVLSISMIRSRKIINTSNLLTILRI